MTIFVYSSGKLVAEYSTAVEPAATAEVAYMATDHLGSPGVISYALGQVVSLRDFMPFGEDLNVGVGNRTGDTGLKYSTPGDNAGPAMLLSSTIRLSGRVLAAVTLVAHTTRLSGRIRETVTQSAAVILFLVKARAWAIFPETTVPFSVREQAGQTPPEVTLLPSEDSMPSVRLT